MQNDYSSHNYLPSVLLVFLCCSQKDIENYVSNESYENIEVVSIDSPSDYPDLISFILEANCDYISFVEPEHIYPTDRLITAIQEFSSNPEADLVISPREFCDSTGAPLLNVFSQYHSYLPGKTLEGRSLLQDCIVNDLCLYGDLSCTVISASFASDILPFMHIEKISPGIRPTALYYHMMVHGKMRFLSSASIQKKLRINESTINNAKIFFDYLRTDLSHRINITEAQISDLESRYISYPLVSLKKDITFFYQNQSEYDLMKPLMNEASKRGYNCRATANITESAVIGVYCSHTNFPENSRFSVILLHDMTQGCDVWPLYWQTESWNKYDLGILPGEFWGNLWKQNALLSCARPRYGVFTLGFPKSDQYSGKVSDSSSLFPGLKMKYDTTILYAPSWEYDDKEDDFIRALHSLPVNLLIKQNKKSFRSNDAFKFVIDNIDNMQSLHEGKYDNLYYLDPDTEFLKAVQLCDLVVSDESSVMTEALLYGIPSVAVTDWMIPDMIPARKAIVPTEWVYRIKKVELRETVERFINGQLNSIDISDWKNKVFGNTGHVAEGILDAIGYYTGAPGDGSFLSSKLTLDTDIVTLWN